MVWGTNQERGKMYKESAQQSEIEGWLAAI